MTFGQIIRQLRREAGMTQEELASLLSISGQAVSRWENELAMPDISLLPILAKIFSVTTDYLLGLHQPQSERSKKMGKYFGTDGFRGEAGVDLTADHAYRIGRFLGYLCSDGVRRRARIAIGKDTRRSSYMLEYAIAAGLTASGADAYMLHVTTTPSVSYVVASENFDAGIMISASHNPYYDNGIKLVSGRGEKADDRMLSAIEDYLDGDYRTETGDRELPYAKGEAAGCIVDYAAGRNRYIGYLISLSLYSFRGFRIGLDCANGSAWMIAKNVFDALGASTYVINSHPDGMNINRDAGSTHIEGLSRLVRDNHLDLGFAFDGDADRCLAVDENGEVVNGDHILYILATEMQRKNELSNNTVVTTVMSNLGLYQAFDRAGIGYEKTAVGDRYVYECMQKNKNCIGGEQSGHIILSKYATTGDGILTAIKLMEAVIANKQTLGKLREPVTMLPQAVKNIPVKNKARAMENERVTARAAEIAEELGGNGRILLRESGTEPVIRVMVEAAEEELCTRYTEEMAALIAATEEEA